MYVHKYRCAYHSVQLDTRKWLTSSTLYSIQKWAHFTLLSSNKRHLEGLLSAYESTHNHNPLYKTKLLANILCVICTYYLGLSSLVLSFLIMTGARGGPTSRNHLPASWHPLAHLASLPHLVDLLLLLLHSCLLIHGPLRGRREREGGKRGRGRGERGRERGGEEREEERERGETGDRDRGEESLHGRREEWNACLCHSHSGNCNVFH